jgi:outer membrane receptor protein involved in Fe transport
VDEQPRAAALFGENSTGGAINYIAAKPTSEFATAGHFSIARFDKTKTTVLSAHESRRP